jgi:hypothetical protein
MKSPVPTYDDYFNWKSGCIGSGYEVELTLVEWIKWWMETGEWANRGRTRDSVCMGRLDFDKPFNLSNIQIMTVRERSQKANIGRTYK